MIQCPLCVGMLHRIDRDHVRITGPAFRWDNASSLFRIFRIWFWICLFLYPPDQGFAVPVSKDIIRLGYLTGSMNPPDNYFYEKPGQSISGGISLAVEEINADDSILPDHHLEFVIAETYGEELESITQTVRLMQENISAYIGPQETCIHEARVASAFNLPMVSYVSVGGASGNLSSGQIDMRGSGLICQISVTYGFWLPLFCERLPTNSPR